MRAPGRRYAPTLAVAAALCWGLAAPGAAGAVTCGDCPPSPFTTLRADISSSVSGPTLRSYLTKVDVAEIKQLFQPSVSVNILRALDNEVRAQSGVFLSVQKAALIHVDLGAVLNCLFIYVPPPGPPGGNGGPSGTGGSGPPDSGPC